MRISTILKSVAALFILGLMPCLYASAENKGVKLLIENFDYPTGSALVENGEWASFDYFGTSTTDSIRIVGGGLTYPGYQPTSIGNSVHLAEVGKDAALWFIPQQGVIYASMLVNVKSASKTAKGDFICSFGDVANSTTAGYGRLYVKNIDGKVAFGVARREIANPSVYAPGRYEFNTTYLIVIKFTQDAQDSHVELFVNPDISGKQPASLISSKEGTNPESLLKFVNLYQGKKEGNDAKIDAIRVATSWEALFDASAVVKIPYIEVPMNVNMGTFEEGYSSPNTRSFIVKGGNLEGDILVNNNTSGYITLSKNKISKADAESEQGFSLSVVLDPKDGKIMTDQLTFTSGSASSTTNLMWMYLIPPPELEAPDVETLKKANKVSFYTLTKPVRVVDVIPEQMGGTTYVIEDATGSVSIYDQMDDLSFQNVRYGSVLTNLRLEIQNADPESSKFIPAFVVAEATELTIADGEPTGVKLFYDVFSYGTGNLVENGAWKDFDYFTKGGEPVKLVSGALKYIYYQDRPKGLAVELNANGKDAFTSFQGVGGTVYASMLVSVSEASEKGDYFFAFNKGASSPGDFDAFGKLCVKRINDKLAFGISQNSFDTENVAYSEAEYEFNQPVLLVVKYYQGPKDGDDFAELFINPKNILGAEPASNLKTTSVGLEPMGNLTYIELLQHTDNGTNYKLLVDAMRVATSWSALFDEKQVESAPMISTGQGGMLYLGFFKQGSEPNEPMVLNIKAENLRSDLTIQGTKEGYYTFSTTSIKKEDAENENGFDVEITLNPTDGKAMNDFITITGTLVRYEIYAYWGYMAKADVNTVADLKEVETGGEYTLVNKVNVKSITAGENNVFIYQLRDESGTLDVQYTKSGPGPRAKAVIDDIKVGDDVRNLCIMVNNVNSEGGFTPTYALTESPNLEITPSSIQRILNGTITGYVDGKFIAESAKSIRLFDVSGNRLLEVDGEVMSMNELPAAMYIVRFVDKTGNEYIMKVVK